MIRIYNAKKLFYKYRNEDFFYFKTHDGRAVYLNRLLKDNEFVFYNHENNTYMICTTNSLKVFLIWIAGKIE